MACPYFEPQQVAKPAQFSSARLPLINEYDGLCHARSETFAAPPEMRFRCCNHGYSLGACPHFPSTDARSGFRYTTVSETPETLELLCIEEQKYTPLHWYSFRYFLREERLEPEIDDVCMRAQVLAFCRSYLERFLT